MHFTCFVALGITAAVFLPGCIGGGCDPGPPDTTTGTGGTTSTTTGSSTGGKTGTGGATGATSSGTGGAGDTGGAGSASGAGGATSTTSSGTGGGAADPFVCGTLTCDAATQFCLHDPDIQDPTAPPYACMPLPSNCGSAPSCGCLSASCGSCSGQGPTGLTKYCPGEG